MGTQNSSLVSVETVCSIQAYADTSVTFQMMSKNDQCILQRDNDDIEGPLLIVACVDVIAGALVPTANNVSPLVRSVSLPLNNMSVDDIDWNTSVRVRSFARADCDVASHVAYLGDAATIATIVLDVRVNNWRFASDNETFGVAAPASAKWMSIVVDIRLNHTLLAAVITPTVLSSDGSIVPLQFKSRLHDDCTFQSMCFG
jgi:hypothetical protein